ncbi:hypothetical protein like AT5G56530 [Hibiscus trionum]|uniref:Neprosin PEP catalytic domain-containing protein n=1 Tax=Hibiscus trionum TaxID=183268 RepID=A0A9W7I1U9_HIBTR|nr:hypothetical protein like AT5G56530 [Hibiscus trionum]
MRRGFLHSHGSTGLVIFLGCVLGLATPKHNNLGGIKPNYPPRHAVKSIQSEDGDIIDCIDINKQPSLEHPALKDHNIQLEPSYIPDKEENPTSEQPSRTVTSQQTWRKSGSCPKGTIPVRRSHHDEKLVRKQGYSVMESPSNVKETNRSKAIVVSIGSNHIGVKGDMRVYQPFVEFDDEYSTTKICLVSGPYYNFESVEAGWAVNPRTYGDRETRFYAYWTADASNKTGCFDITCPGFVQVSHEIALGAALSPISVIKGLPWLLTLFLFKDQDTNNIWVRYEDRINIGYWPADLFGYLTFGAEAAEWGGEVYSTKLGRPPHTGTHMGNGQFPDWGTGYSGYFKRMRILDIGLNLKMPQWMTSYDDEYWCYRGDYISDYIEDPEYYYGGPGRNWRCP